MPRTAAGLRGSLPGTLISAALSVSLLLLFVLPLVALVGYVPFGDIVNAGNDPGVRQALWFTLFASGLAVGITIGFGVPLGYLLARRSFPGKAVVESVVTVPIVVPHFIVGLALLLLFAPTSPLGALMVRAGIPIFQSVWGVVLVMVYVSAPYTVLASQIAFRSVDDRLLEAARCLGATPSEAFSSVTLPLALRGILTGGMLSWARSVSEIGGFLILAYTVYPSPPYGGPVTSPISMYIYNLYQIGDLHGAISVASFFVLVAFAVFIVVRLLERAGRLPWRRGELFP